MSFFSRIGAALSLETLAFDPNFRNACYLSFLPKISKYVIQSKYFDDNKEHLKKFCFQFIKNF